MAALVCAILAAGASSRMPTQKMLLGVGERTLVARALDASAGYPRVVVASGAVLESGAWPADAVLIRNDEPERGMAHSLRLADAALSDRTAALAVLLGDTPFVDGELVARIAAARGAADVAYPVRAGVPGHPVIFGPRPRTLIAGLGDGDTLRHLRADERFTRVEVAVDDDRPFLDVDTPADLATARRLMETEPPPAKS
jgi:CTP:molybdopterin cytidylyltransferase MocA